LEVVQRAAEHLGKAAGNGIELAAALRDVGRVGVSNVVWEKPGPLSSEDWEQVRMHAYHAERIVARSPRLSSLARDVGMHHERLDGSGYHRGSSVKEIGSSARLIAVADSWVAMQQPRPYRRALEPDEAAGELAREAEAGKLDPDAVAAVLASSGHPVRARRPRPGGLTSREVEVLRLMSSGASNPEIASELNISARTAEHHVQHIYTKIGVSTRPAAALFAVENDLLVPIGV
jgi:DNA-binding CsgD family transcriptional regulator